MNKKAKPKKRYIECGICGEKFSRDEMVRDIGSPTGYICIECHHNLHPEYDIDEW